MNLLKRTFGRKPKSPVTVPDPEFPRLEGLHYIDFLARYHEINRPGTYLEVGSQKGKSLQSARGRCIAIDPSFCFKVDVIADKEDLYLYQGTSDDFFASEYLARVGAKIDFAFLDGMHLFEFLLRDFIHTERFVTGPTSVIALHDCVPYAKIMATRDWDKSVTRSWTGDVWKMIPILRRYRPDLEVKVLDCAPTGLVLIGNCDSRSRVLESAYDEIIAEYTELTLEGFGIEQFIEELKLVPAADYPLRHSVD